MENAHFYTKGHMHPVIYSCAAYDVFAPVLKHHDGAAKVTENTNVRVLVGGMWRAFRFGSVVSYALHCGDDPVEAIDRARERGHDLVWCNAEASVLTAEARPLGSYIGLHIGGLVRFEGVTYVLVAEPNDNVGMRRVD